MERKILVIVDSINVDDSSGSKANVAFINNLAEVGFEVFVFHYTHLNIQLTNVNCYAIPEIKFSISYLLSRCQRIIQRYLKVNLAKYLEQVFGFSFTFYNDVNSIKKSLKKISFQPDLLITLSKGASFRPHNAVLKTPYLHTKWLAYVHDPYPFHYYPEPYDWVEPGNNKKEDFFQDVSKKARYSAFPSLLLKDWMGKYFPNFLKTGIVIPHQISSRVPENSLFPDYFEPTKFNLLHAGNLMKQRSPEGLIEGFKLFLKHNPNSGKEARLLLLGPASYHEKRLEYYLRLVPEMYVCNQKVPFREIYGLQNHVSVNIILEASSEISPFLPGKFPHCIAANKPILHLGPKHSETMRLLGDEYEYHSQVDDVDNIASLIERLYNIWKENPNSLVLNRVDLLDYMSKDYLKKSVNDLLDHSSF